MIEAIVHRLYFFKGLFECLAHRRRPTDPYFANFICVVLGQLFSNKSAVPTICINALTAQSDNNLEIGESVDLAIVG